MKCPCCNGEVILDTLAKHGEFQVDVKCSYCHQTGTVGFSSWLRFHISPYSAPLITAAFIGIVVSTIIGIKTKKDYIYLATLVANFALSTYLSLWWFVERKR